jgi:hypothetical protein
MATSISVTLITAILPGNERDRRRIRAVIIKNSFNRRILDGDP